MKSLRFACGPALGLVLVGAFLGTPLKAEDSPLEKAMKNMQDAKKELYPAMKAPVAANKDRYLALAKILKTEATASRDLVPEMAEKLPAPEKTAMIEAYRKEMDEFIKSADSLIAALEKEQWDQAQTVVAQMKDEEKAGHKAYRPHKEKPGGPGGPGAPGNAPAANPAPTAPGN